MTFPLPYLLTISGVRGLDGITFHEPAHVVSILDPGWDEPERLRSLDPSALTTLRFHDDIHQKAERVPPSRGDVARLVDLGRRLVNEDCRHLHVHCHLGVSRSTAAAAILLEAGRPGNEHRIFDEIDRVRERNWPNSQMIRFADELLGCEGRFVAALSAHYRRIAARDPELVRLIREHGRSSEVPQP